MTKYGVWLAALALCIVSAGNAQAQRFGAQVSFGTDTEIGVGARVEYDLAGKLSKNEPLSRAFFAGQFDWWLDPCDPGDCTMWELNPSIAIPLKATTLRPYVGAGLNIAHVSVDLGSFGKSSDTDIGINVLGGLKFALGGMDAFTEARFALGGMEQLALSLGILFGGSK